MAITAVGSTIVLNKFLLKQEALKEYSNEYNPLYNAGLTTIGNMLIGNDVSILTSVLSGVVSQYAYNEFFETTEEEEQKDENEENEDEDNGNNSANDEGKNKPEKNRDHRTIGNYFKTGYAYAKDHPQDFFNQQVTKIGEHALAGPESIALGPVGATILETSGANKKIFDTLNSWDGSLPHPW